MKARKRWSILNFSLGFISANVSLLLKGINIGSYPNPFFPFFLGEIKPLIFLVDFKDKELNKYTQSHFEQLFFADDLSQNTDFPEGHSGHGNYLRSVRDYYDEISNNKLDISGSLGSIVDWHEVQHDYEESSSQFR